MDDDFILSSTIQNTEKIGHKVFNVHHEPNEPMTYGEFRAMLDKAEQHLDEKAIEDTFWNKISTEKIVYGDNNPLSLFGMTVDAWNLDKFTKDQSIIHSKPSHHLLKVSAFQE